MQETTMMYRFAIAAPPFRLGGALGALVLATACSGPPTGPPEIVLDRSTCFSCGMLISEPAYAAGYRVGPRTAVFDDIGCLLADLGKPGPGTDESADGTAQSRAAVETSEVWFLDGDQRWIAAADAVFVRSPRLETPMGGHIEAFSDRARAERTAARVGGVVVESFAELMAGTRAAALGGEGR
jgi:nitrous oxide reductase accessory protein NosL